MQKVWSSIDSWKGEHMSLQPPAPAPAQGGRERGAGSPQITHLYDILLRCQFVLVVSDREAYVWQAGQSSAVYKKLYAMH